MSPSRDTRRLIGSYSLFDSHSDGAREVGAVEVVRALSEKLEPSRGDVKDDVDTVDLTVLTNETDPR